MTLEFCAKRRLYVQPARDCKRCHWYECVEFPHPELMEEFKKCWTYKGNRTRPDLKGKPNPYVWDGTKEHCRRYQLVGELHACQQCTLNRPCEHRGEEGKLLLEYHKKTTD